MTLYIVKLALSQVYRFYKRHIMSTDLASDFLGLRYAIEVFLQFVQAPPVIADLLLYFIWIHSTHRTMHPVTVNINKSLVVQMENHLLKTNNNIILYLFMTADTYMYF